MGFEGKQNVYTCDNCQLSIITEDIDEGTTPMFLNCRASEECDGQMASAMYSKMPFRFVPHFIWRKPTEKEYKVMSPGMQKHINDFGLEIYPVQ